jgi:hypothetical protein
MLGCVLPRLWSFHAKGEKVEDWQTTPRGWRCTCSCHEWIKSFDHEHDISDLTLPPCTGMPHAADFSRRVCWMECLCSWIFPPLRQEKKKVREVRIFPIQNIPSVSIANGEFSIRKWKNSDKVVSGVNWKFPWWPLFGLKVTCLGCFRPKVNGFSLFPENRNGRL